MMRLSASVLRLGAGLALAVAPMLATTPVATPEPSSILLVGGGVAGLILLVRRQRSRK